MIRSDPSGWAVPWDPARARMLVASGAWSNRTMAQEAADLVARAPAHVIAVEGERRWTSAELYARSLKLAAAFAAYGLQRGDRISYQLPNWSEAIVIDLAATMAGLVVNPMVAIYREAEVGFMLDELQSRMIFIPAIFRRHDYRDMMRRVRARLDHHVDVVVLRGDADGFIPYETLFDADYPPVDPVAVDADDIKLALYTSGTTGRAKAVLHSHNSVSAMAAQFGTHLRIGQGDATLVSSPVTHITGAILAFQLPWTTGARAVLMDIWDGEKAVSLIRAEAISVANGAAPFVADLVAAAKSSGDRLPSLRVFVAGGSAIPESLARLSYTELESCILFRAYGATEMPVATLGELSREQMDRNIRCDGRPVYTELKIVCPVNGTPVPHGESGEIVMRGPQRMLGYLRAEDNVAAFDEHGYFRTGDLGRYVWDDWIEVTGRAKDIIIRAGENISPAEIEAALLDSPLVTAVAIVAKPDQRTGEAACAFVVPPVGVVPTIDDLARFLTERGFAKQKIPEHLVLVDALPTTPAGKVQKHILRDRARDLTADTSAMAGEKHGPA